MLDTRRIRRYQSAVSPVPTFVTSPDSGASKGPGFEAEGACPIWVSLALLGPRLVPVWAGHTGGSNVPSTLRLICYAGSRFLKSVTRIWLQHARAAEQGLGGVYFAIEVRLGWRSSTGRAPVL